MKHRANALLLTLVEEMNSRLDHLTRQARRKVKRGDGYPAIAVLIDELAYYCVVAGDQASQTLFIALLRDLVARGRAVGIIVVAATQRPSADIVPTSLRDIFAYRVAFRCATKASSDIILGTDYAALATTPKPSAMTNPALVPPRRRRQRPPPVQIRLPLRPRHRRARPPSRRHPMTGRPSRTSCRSALNGASS